MMRSGTENGFTLLEILITLALLGMIAGLSIGVGISTYRREIFSSEVSTVVGLLHAARNRAMNNLYQSTHGVRVEADNFVLFYDGVDNDIPRSSLITVEDEGGDPTFEIEFEQLSGEIAADKEIVFIGDVRRARIKIDHNGKIEWAYE